MGIDGIGKPGPLITPATPASTGATPPAAHVDHAPFAERAAEARATSAVVGPRAALEQLRAGTVNLDGYLDIKVQEATASMGDLAPAQLARVRSALRERISSDPTLVELVRKATGALEIPAPSLED
jgi:hypothetical protein